jgi:hypothetical protein
MSPNSPVARAIAMLGGPSEVARRRGLKTAWAVSKWRTRGVPAEHVIWLAEQTNFRFTPHQLAPAFYPHSDDGVPTHRRGGPPSGQAA